MSQNLSGVSSSWQWIAFLTCILCGCASHRTQETDMIQREVATPSLRVAFGSCNRTEDDQSFWHSILGTKPNIWVWLGDNIYADTRVPRIMREKYQALTKNRFYEEFKTHVKITGTWDDHDYGENDAGRDYPMRRRSKELFAEFIAPATSDLIAKQDGIYRSEVWWAGNKKIKAILLDARYNRDKLVQNSFHEYVPTDGDVLGPAQWLWLEKELDGAKDSDALVVATGTQVLSRQHRFEKWANFPKARDRLLKLIENAPVKTKIILSGDRHFAEIAQLRLPNGSTVTEVTASGLTHSYANASEENEFRVGALWPKRNYGRLDFFDEGERLRTWVGIFDLLSGRVVGQVELPGGP